MKIENVKLDLLIPYARNSRTHSDAQVAQIAASIKEFGFTNPVLIDEMGSIIAGHGRVMAARKLAIIDVPSIRLTHLTEAQKKAYVIADNKLALNAGWDDEMLAVELTDLKDMGFDLDLTGFNTDEIEALLAPVGTEGLTDEDAVPEVPEAPVTVLGDVWLLGKHRVMCGDSTSIDAVDTLLAGVKPHLMVTDPPYGVEYDPTWRDDQDAAKGKKIGGRAVGKVKNDDCADWREAWALFPGDVVYCWTSGRFLPESILSLEAAGFERRVLIVWAKSQHVFGRGHYHSQEEECWYAVRKGATGHWQGDHKQTTLWQIPKPSKSETGHGTQKPVECMRRPIGNNSSPGQAVYDPFTGSGTTVIAAETTGRCCYSMELDPKYCDVIVQRWQEFTGQTATLESNGKPFISLKKVA